MYFRHHSIEIYAKDFLKLDYSFWTNDCPLAEPCVKHVFTLFSNITWTINFLPVFDEFIVLPISKIADSEIFSEFDKDTFDLMVKEGIGFAIDVISPTRAESDKVGCILEKGRVKVPKCMHEPYQKAYELGLSLIHI